MTVMVTMYLSCTACSRGMWCNESRRFVEGETPEELYEEAPKHGWVPNVLVPNGSRWDFCPKCYAHYLNENKLDKPLP